MLGSYALSIVFIGILVWVYRQLSTPDALQKLKEFGYNTEKPKSALYVAIAFMVLGGVFFSFIVNSESAIKAKALAKEQLGSQYSYQISSLSMSSNRGSAVVTAYNSNGKESNNILGVLRQPLNAKFTH